MSSIQYAHPETLITTGWAAAHLGDPKVRFFEIDADPATYQEGHLPGAININWATELSHPLVREIVPKKVVEKFLTAAGVTADTTVIVYGDSDNYYAAFALWVLKIYGHPDVRLMNGGRKKWIAEAREKSFSVRRYLPSAYVASERNELIRARRDLVLDSIKNFNRTIVDVRSVQEFTGEIIAPPGIGESARRAGHIPGAISIPCELFMNAEGLLRSAEELDRILGRRDLKRDHETIVYGRTGERSALAWFVLKYLAGFEKVRNYDGSWTEYGNLVGVPIERS